MTDELTDEQLAEAQREGLSPEEYRVVLNVQVREAARSSGMTETAFRGLMEEARQTRGSGISLHKWAERTGRDQHGRKLAP